MVAISIRNEVNVRDKAIGIRFRRKDPHSADVILKVLEKVTRSTSLFNALYKLILEVHSVNMPGGFGRSIKTNVRPLDTLSHLKKSIVRVKSETNCLAHALIIAIAKITKEPNYKSYRDGRKLCPVVQRLLETTGINLAQGRCTREINQFQEYFKNRELLFFRVLIVKTMYSGQVQTEKEN